MSRRLVKSTLVTGGMTLLSRISGFVRDMVLARLIGSSLAADAFFVAFRIPNFMRRIFGEGAFSQAFVPVFAEYHTKDEHRAMREFVDYVAGVLGLALVIVTVIGIVAAPLLIWVLAPGFAADAAKYDLTVQMLRIMFPYLLFISLVAMAAGVLNTLGRFGVPAFTPVLLNLCLIGAALLWAPHTAQPVVALAWGVFIAGAVQLLFQFPSLWRLRLLPRPRLGLRHAGVRRVFGLMVPAVFGVSVAQINLLINTILASFLVTGSVSWLYYSDRLMEFPLGVFGVALATVILPNLSKKHQRASHRSFSHTLDWALRWAWLVGLPATAGLIVLAGPMVVTLFNYGAFNAHDVAMTRLSLIAFSVGLLGFLLIKVLATGFYARQDMKTPVRIGVIALFANIGFSLALVFGLAHTGLALATSLAAFVNAGLLYRGLRRSGSYTPLSGWPWLLARTLLASGAMSALLWWGAGELDAWLAAPALARAARLGAWIFGGVVVYVVSMYALGVRWRSLALAKADGEQD